MIVGIISLETLFGLLAAAGEVYEIPLAPWPHHLAMRRLAEGATSRSPFLPALKRLEFRPSPDVGLQADGVMAAIKALVVAGALCPGAGKPVRKLRINQHWRNLHAGMLTHLEREDVELLRQTGKRWAASVPASSNSSVRATSA